MARVKKVRVVATAPQIKETGLDKTGLIPPVVAVTQLGGGKAWSPNAWSAGAWASTTWHAGVWE
jgi:hypothetical protein